MGIAILETAMFVFQMSKKGVKIVAKNPEPGAPKYGLVSHAWYKALVNSTAPECYDAAVLAETGPWTKS